MLLLACAAACAAAGTSVAVGAAAYVGPGWPGIFPGYAFPYPLPPYASACPLYGPCVAPWWDERRMRPRPMAPQPQQPASDLDIWGSTGSPWGYVRRLPPPTPDSQIQPRYRDASTIRPEYGGPP